MAEAAGPGDPLVTTERIYITKHALTRGILTADADIRGELARLGTRGQAGNVYYHGEGRDWHRTEEAARAKVAKMIAKRLASLQKQIETLKQDGRAALQVSEWKP
jgi:virulence-associated protein VapD